MSADPAAPLAGVRVLEVAMGMSAVGSGMASSLPGALLRDLGATVTRVQSEGRGALDEGVEFARVWNRGKDVIDVDGQDDYASTVAALAQEADVLFVAGGEESVERIGLGYCDLAPSNPRLTHVRIRPSSTAAGPVPDPELLLHARTGLLTQIRGHRPGPVFCDLAVASAGAGLAATVGALACLYEREATGIGGWAETSAYDGMQAMLAMIIGRVSSPSRSTASLWNGQGPSLALSFVCADGEYVQLWFGAKGAYEAFLENIGDSPSEQGYAADTLSGAIGERSARWADKFASQDRSWWVEKLAGHDFRCEPVMRPGEILRDPHVREIGLSVDYSDPELGMLTVLGPVGKASAVGMPQPLPTMSAPAPRLLSGVRVLDLSAYLAGPVTPQILAELGADVVKVEPTTGDAHRGVEPMFAASQRGKRAVALDLKAPEAREVLDRLVRWSDVLHHNSRIGQAERLGYDEDTVRAVNPNVVYSHASGFGPHGPRAALPANDHLMQALSGVEAAQGGDGQAPTFLAWGAIDAASGWVAACAVLAGLYARRRSGTAQSVTSSLLGAAMLLKSGAFLVGGAAQQGPILDHQQTGYGAAYRIYQAKDGSWLALAIQDSDAWERLRQVVGGEDLPPSPPPLRTRNGEPQQAEELLEQIFATKDAAAWVAELRAAAVSAELVAEEDRTGFIAGLLDDSVSRKLRGVVSLDWGARGKLEQPAFPLRFGPAPRPGAQAHIPGLGEHTDTVLEALAFDQEARAKLAAAAVTAAMPDGRPASTTGEGQR